MAKEAAEQLKAMGIKVSAIYTSPLVRAQESARPIEELFGIDAKTVLDGDVVLVTHQLPIWVMHLSSSGKKLMHDPRKRRCALSSITTFEIQDGKLVEVGYLDPASNLASIDKGAV